MLWRPVYLRRLGNWRQLRSHARNSNQFMRQSSWHKQKLPHNFKQHIHCSSIIYICQNSNWWLIYWGLRVLHPLKSNTHLLNRAVQDCTRLADQDNRYFPIYSSSSIPKYSKRTKDLILKTLLHYALWCCLVGAYCKSFIHHLLCQWRQHDLLMVSAHFKQTSHNTYVSTFQPCYTIYLALSSDMSAHFNQTTVLCSDQAVTGRWGGIHYDVRHYVKKNPQLNYKYAF